MGLNVLLIKMISMTQAQGHCNTLLQQQSGQMGHNLAEQQVNNV